jgi:hypothetical protein
MWLLGFELGTFGRAVGALNHWAISPAPSLTSFVWRLIFRPSIHVHSLWDRPSGTNSFLSLPNPSTRLRAEAPLEASPLAPAIMTLPPAQHSYPPLSDPSVSWIKEDPHCGISEPKKINSCFMLLSISSVVQNSKMGKQQLWSHLVIHSNVSHIGLAVGPCRILLQRRNSFRMRWGRWWHISKPTYKRNLKNNNKNPEKQRVLTPVVCLFSSSSLLKEESTMIWGQLLEIWMWVRPGVTTSLYVILVTKEAEQEDHKFKTSLGNLRRFCLKMIHTYIQTYIHTYIHTYNTQTHIHVHIHMHTYTHIHWKGLGNIYCLVVEH